MSDAAVRRRIDRIRAAKAATAFEGRVADAAARSKRFRRQHCTRCKRTVQLVTIAGQLVAVDMELISVVPNHGGPQVILARRVHADLCLWYRMQTELAKARRDARKASAP